MGEVEPTVADLVVERLRAWGVQRLFGYSGDGIDPILGALRRAGGEPDFVQARHEEMAAFMATGHAKYTGEVGVCLATQGPGAVHLLTGLYDAKLDKQPVVAIVGQQPTSVLGSEYQQEIDLTSLFRDACAQFTGAVLSPEQLPMVLDKAIRTALATRSPTVLVIPHDVQTAPAPAPPAERHEHGVIVTSPGLPTGRLEPAGDDLRRAAEVLNAGERVALLVGQGAWGAGDLVARVAERLGAGVATSLLGKPVLDESRPESVGVMGHLGTTASHRLLQGCDTLLLVGTNDPWTEFYPAPGQARAVQIDADGRNLGQRYPVEVPLLGHAVETLEALEPLLERSAARDAWRSEVERSVVDWHALAEAKARSAADPLNPQLVVHELSSRLPGDALVSVDVGSITYWYARHLRLAPGVPAHLSSTLACMGSALPYGLAAKLAAPDRPVVALAGDGAVQMSGLGEIVTVAQRWRDWADPRFVVLVLHNGDLAEVTWEQREMEGEPRYDASQTLPDFPFAAYADLLGLEGIRVTEPVEVGPAWDRALSAGRPVIIEAMVDPSVALLAPLQPFEAVRAMYEALEEEGAGRARAHLLRERELEGFDDLAELER